jgi:serralysin
MSGLTSTERATIAFETGLDPNGTLNSVNGWRWDGNTPAGYGSYGSAHKWAGGAAGTSGGTVTYYFDPGSNWSAA